MKTNLLSAIATAVAALAFTSGAYAQLLGDAHIAASPKVSQMLNERKAAASPVLHATPAMSCSNCADIRIVKFSPQAKGAEVLTGTKQVTYAHTCAGCNTKLAVAGVGKAKHSVATHSCSLAVASSPTCCASK